jgi:hypothetical protein
VAVGVGVFVGFGAGVSVGDSTLCTVSWASGVAASVGIGVVAAAIKSTLINSGRNTATATRGEEIRRCIFACLNPFEPMEVSFQIHKREIRDFPNA